MERTIKPDALKHQHGQFYILDVRRQNDFDASNECIPNSLWKNPEQVDSWINEIPKDRDTVIYCVRGGGVSNGTLDKLHGAGIKARFIEGGIEAWKSAGGAVRPK